MSMKDSPYEIALAAATGAVPHGMEPRPGLMDVLLRGTTDLGVSIGCYFPDTLRSPIVYSPFLPSTSFWMFLERPDPGTETRPPSHSNTI